MEAAPILPSSIDLERRRLESNIDQDLHSLSLGSLITTSTSQSNSNSHKHDRSSSFSSVSSVEFARGFGEGYTGQPSPLATVFPTSNRHTGPHGTPRAAARKASGMSVRSEVDSPVSTAGHHVSAVTLGEGIFRTGRGAMNDSDMDSGDEFDPERSLGRLVGELGKVMNGRISPRPTSPFAALSPPRSPSPFSSVHHPNVQNLSLTLNRNDPLPSPPRSRSGSRSSCESARVQNGTSSRFSSIARELGNDLKARRVFGESTAQNVPPTPLPSRSRANKEKNSEKDRLRALQGERRPASAPARLDGDMTGMTGLLETPAKGGAYGSIGTGDVGTEAGNVPQALSTLQARLRALETENSLSRRRVRELEEELERARGEVNSAKQDGSGRLREVIGEKTALEDLITSLRKHLARITNELEQSKELVAELRLQQQTAPPPHISPPRPDNTVRKELIALRHEVERLGKEVHRLGGIVEEGIDTRRRARGERTIRMEQAEAAKLAQELIEEEADITKAREDMERRQATRAPSHRSAPMSGPSRLPSTIAAIGVRDCEAAGNRVASGRSASPVSEDDHISNTPTNGSKKSASRRQGRMEGPSSPFPSIRDEDEEDFFSMLDDAEKSVRPIPVQGAKTAQSPWAGKFRDTTRKASSNSAKSGRSRESAGNTIPPQTVLARVIGELEADFAHYKAIYAELADQYKVLDAASAVAKRRVLAEHLKEVIDTLEQKADQISSLYDLLAYKDKPDSQSVQGQVKKSVPDILRIVKESLGEEGLKRLEEDGIGIRKKKNAGLV